MGAATDPATDVDSFADIFMTTEAELVDRGDQLALVSRAVGIVTDITETDGHRAMDVLTLGHVRVTALDAGSPCSCGAAKQDQEGYP